MLRVGLVGIGFMGWMHYLAYQRSKHAKLVAFASRDSKKRQGDWRGIQGNFGPPGEQIDVSSLSSYASIDDLIADSEVDVIDICLPPNLHAEVAIAALKAGKHVLCEKPIALNSTDADAIIEAAHKAQRLVMIAQVLPYIGPFEYAAKLVESGEYGKPIGGLFKRSISNPEWIPDFFDPTTVGGPLIDLNIHDMHFIRMLFGMPISVTAVGSFSSKAPAGYHVAKFANVSYEFSDPKFAVASTGGVVDGHGRPFTHGFELHLERGWLQFELAAFTDNCEVLPLKVVPHQGSIIRPELSAADDVTAFLHEIDDMAKSIRENKVAKPLDPQLARDAIKIAECVQASLIKRQTIKV